jgi:hypothetical protein
MKKAIYRWKKHEKETGLRAVGAGPRGSDYQFHGDSIATVCPHGGDWRKRLSGWYFVVSTGAVYKNTCNELSATESEAKAAAVEFMRANGLI